MKKIIIFLFVFLISSQSFASEKTYSVYASSPSTTVTNCIGDCGFIFDSTPNINFGFSQTWGNVGYYIDFQDGIGYGADAIFGTGKWQYGANIGLRNIYANLNYSGTTNVTSGNIPITEMSLFARRKVGKSDFVIFKITSGAGSYAVNANEQTGIDGGGNPIYTSRSANFNINRSYIQIGYSITWD